MSKTHHLHFLALCCVQITLFISEPFISLSTFFKFFETFLGKTVQKAALWFTVWKRSFIFITFLSLIDCVCTYHSVTRFTKWRLKVLSDSKILRFVVLPGRLKIILQLTGIDKNHIILCAKKTYLQKWAVLMLYDTLQVLKLEPIFLFRLFRYQK